MRSRHDPSYIVYRDMYRYLLDHDAPEHFQPEQHVEPFPFATVLVGAAVVWLLLLALLGVLI